MAITIAPCRTCGNANDGPFLNCATCHDRSNANKARYRASSTGRATEAAYVASERARGLARQRQAAYRNKAEAKEARAAWLRSTEGRAYARLSTQRYRARKRGATVMTIAASGLRGKLRMYAGVCWICRSAPWDEWDHVKPLSKGGMHALSNLRPACRSCNRSKAGKWPYAVTRAPRRFPCP